MTIKKNGEWEPAKPINSTKNEKHTPDIELAERVHQILVDLRERYYSETETNQKLTALSKSLFTDVILGHSQIVFGNPSGSLPGADRFLRGHVPEVNKITGSLRFTPDSENIFSNAEPIVEIQEGSQYLPVSEWSLYNLNTFLSDLGLADTDLTNREWTFRDQVTREALVSKKIKQFSQDAKRTNALSDTSIDQLIDEALPRSQKIINTNVGLRITENNKQTGQVVETFTVNIVRRDMTRRIRLSDSEWQIEVVCGSGQATRYDWGKDIDWSQTVLVRKPIIYLYPTEPTQVSVNLDYTRGPVVVEYPKRENGSWKVNAQADGKLLVGDKEYPYLFWEAKPTTPYQFDQTEGFCLGKDEFTPFFEEKLKFLGLNDKEVTDFITYWYPLMANNPFTYVNFLGQEYLNSAKLTVSPAPESSIRVFVIFKSMTERANLKPQELAETPRNGFTLVEWGGSNLDDK